MMKLFTFKKGIHPPSLKEATENCKIVDLAPEGDLVFPMAQHIGAPCVPTVQAGNRVLVGQVIGESNTFISAPIHSSVSGTVKKIAPVLTPMGSKSLSVVVENDGKYEEVEGIHPKDYTSMTSDEIRSVIRDAGVVGKGGACFPTVVKLSPPPSSHIEYIIVNGAECEPYLTCDHRLMVEFPSEIVEGIRIVQRLFPRARGIIAIEDNKPEAIACMKKVIRGIPNIEVAAVETKYPQGAEKILIYALIGREVKIDQIPADVGCVAMNARTVFQIQDAFATGRPVMSRIVTIAGEAVRKPGNFRVKLGSSFRELVKAAGGFKEPPGQILAGGPMMGMSLTSSEVPIIKGTSGFVCLTKDQVKVEDEASCIRCGKCVEVCPMRLMPFDLYSLVTRRKYAEFEAAHGLNCMECGCCSWGCPARLHLVQTMREGKKTVRDMKRKEKG